MKQPAAAPTDRSPAELCREFGSFELRFEPCAALVSVVRRFVLDFYRQMVDDAETVSALALATHELLENTVKYSSNGRGELSVAVDARGELLQVSVRTRNAALASDIAVLERSFEKLSHATDADDYYRETICESIEHDQGSGLGLARIFAEAGMRLELEVRGDHVQIIAERAVPLPSAAQEVSCNP